MSKVRVLVGDIHSNTKGEVRPAGAGPSCVTLGAAVDLGWILLYGEPHLAAFQLLFLVCQADHIVGPRGALWLHGPTLGQLHSRTVFRVGLGRSP